MGTRLQHLNFAADLDPTLKVMRPVSLVEQRSHLHTEAALQLGALVDLPEPPQRPVRLYSVPEASILVDIRHLTARVRVD